jgi:hypothetical protein
MIVAKYFSQLVDDLTTDDIVVFHGILCGRVLGYTIIGPDVDLMKDVYIRGILKFMREHEMTRGVLNFDETLVIHYLKRCQVWKEGSLFVDYIATVYSLSADSGKMFADKIEAEIRTDWNMPSGIVFACCGLAIRFQITSNRFGWYRAKGYRVEFIRIGCDEFRFLLPTIRQWRERCDKPNDESQPDMLSESSDPQFRHLLRSCHSSGGSSHRE